jgi:hypothetical protein
MYRYILLITALTSILVGARAVGQAPTAGEVDQWIARYKVTGDEYAKVFLNLVAEETKVIETFDSTGRLSNRREIVSDLLAYQSPRSAEGATAELRDVRSVDGKPVKNRDKRILDLVRQVGKTDSVEKEIERINRESHRYDGKYRDMYTTVYPGSVKFRDKFRFEWVGRDRIGGNEVVIIDYREMGSNPIASFWKQMGFSTVFSRGRLWLDATTAQLRQERYELAGIHPAVSEPVTLLRLRRENTNGDYSLGILTPQRIEIEHFFPPKTRKNLPPAFDLVNRSTLTYGRFRRFDVTAQQTIAPPER